MKKSIVSGFVAAGLLLSLSAEAQYPKEISLWKDGAPGTAARRGEAEVVRITPDGNDHFITNVHNPTITPFVPAAEKSTGTAIIIAPGGGHRELRMDNEGYWSAKWFMERGIAVFVLKYRLANETGSPYKVDADELADIQRAIRAVRARAKEWHIDTAKVGVMGFSAGGELAGLAAMKYDNGKEYPADDIDKFNSRPNFQALIYPGGTKRLEIVKNIPPIFLAAGYKDRADIAEGIAQVYLKYKQAGVKADIHIFTEAGHGFGINPNGKRHEVTLWSDLFIDWLADLGLTKRL